MLQFIRNRHRKDLLAAPFPEAWMAFLQANVQLYSHLTAEEQVSVRNDLTIFLAEKVWEGCDGLEMTDEIKVTISAHACLLTIGLEHDYYPNVESILVYPAEYIAPAVRWQPGGIVEEGPSARLGEAWPSGPIVFSWQDVMRGGRGQTPGRNVALHEFAHKLDMASGGADGVPRLHADADYDRWAIVMSSEYQALLARLEHGAHALMDPYAATNSAEFFAVATEMFFETGPHMHTVLPALYDVLQGFYRQDPAGRSTNASAHRIKDE